MNIQRIAAFSDGNTGGNPAGVVLLDAPSDTDTMQAVAADVGYSETVFAVRQSEGTTDWAARYFSPESEVPFCGHATIALGAVLGQTYGEGTYSLTLQNATISVHATRQDGGIAATLVSPPTHSAPLANDTLQQVLDLFGMTQDQLDPRIPPAHVHGGANHIALSLARRTDVSAMAYDLDQGRRLMRALDVVTIMLIHADDERSFFVRNAFASGGVLEDPATGAAAAAFAGYLRDIGWPHQGAFTIQQGHDMGSPSVINVTLDDVPGAPVRVSGFTRNIVE